MKHVKNSCGGRGCSINHIILPHDSRSKLVYMEMYGTKNDIQKVLPLVNISLDYQLEKKRQMGKKAA